MELLYSKHRSEIVEFLMAPFAVQKEQMETLEERNQKEKEMLKEALFVQQQLRLVFETMQDRLSICLMGENIPFLHYLYFELLEEGQDPQTLEEACQLLANLPQQMIERAIRSALIVFNRDEAEQKEDVLELLEQIEMKAEDKWKWFQAIRRPLETVHEQLALVLEVAPLYRPYYEAFQQQRLAFAHRFSYEEMYGEQGLYQSSGVEELGYDRIHFLVLSPWLTHFFYVYNRYYQTYSIILYASVDIDYILLMPPSMDENLLTRMLKIMSDETRYKVMVALTKPYAKSKDLATQLGITGAAVSFHTQKLLNNKLLLFNTADKTVKFDANKELLREMIAKIKEDFDL